MKKKINIKKLFTFTLALALSFSLVNTPILNKAYALKQYELDMINVYKKVSPSVVSVMTVSYDEDFFMEPVPRQGAGSGVVIDMEGHILTNNHVVQGASKIDILFGKKSYPAKIVGTAPNNDLAVLKVSAPKDVLKPAKLGDSSKLQIGQTAIAIGNPFGILGRTMTTGIISGLDRDVKADTKILRGMIQTDAAINGGNSGGPLVNTDGQVIGINTLIFSQSGGSVGIGFSIPINLAKKFIPSLINKGKVTYPWLGVSVLPINEKIASILKLPVKQGLLILETVQGGAADNAGLRGGNKYIVSGNTKIPVGGDIILELDGDKVTTAEDLSSYLETNKEVGSNVKVTLVRGTNAYEVNVKLQARPSKR